MAGRIKPALDRLFKREMQGLVVDLSKKTKVVAVVVTRTDCGNCVYDPVNKRGTGRHNGTGPTPFEGKICPVCQNLGWLEQTRQRVLKASVRFPSVTQQDVRTTLAGSIPEGHAKIKVLVQDEPILRQADHFLIDGVKYRTVGDPQKRGLLSYAVAELLVKKDE